MVEQSGTFGSKTAEQAEDLKFNLQPIDTMISNKTNMLSQKPCKSYIEIQFNKDTEAAFFNYIILQNFYTYSITIKQYKGPTSSDIKEAKKNESNWVTVLKNYQLMRNAHFETDAQNWHIIGTELFNTKFERRSLRLIRIYLTQPSPSWLDYTLRNINLFMKKYENKYQEKSGQQRQLTPFEQLKMGIKNNLKGLRKDEEGEKNKVAHLQKKVNTLLNRIQDFIPAFNYQDDIRKLELLQQ